jgi:predicted flavoprotein YhiN
MAALPPEQPGSMLWTHFGISGPAALDLSRHWLRARLEGRAAEATANLTPDFHFESLEDFWLDQARHRPRAMLGTVLATQVPAAVAGGCSRRSASTSRRHSPRSRATIDAKSVMH